VFLDWVVRSIHTAVLQRQGWVQNATHIPYFIPGVSKLFDVWDTYDFALHVDSQNTQIFRFCIFGQTSVYSSGVTSKLATKRVVK
jgi:hypothetical protein